MIKLRAHHNALRFVKLCCFIAHTHILDACVCPADCMCMHVFVTGLVIGQLCSQTSAIAAVACCNHHSAQHSAACMGAEFSNQTRKSGQSIVISPPLSLSQKLEICLLSQEWLWCETWCGNATKEYAKTIDLCNNPLTKEPKLQGARRIVSEWPALDEEARSFTAKVHILLPTGMLWLLM